MFIIGIDGGGTHTRMELRDMQNQPIFRKTFGPFNMSAIGEPAFRERIQEIASATGDLKEAAAICIGGAGSTGGAMERVLCQELNAAGFAGELLLRGDHEVALAGAVEGPGCVLIAGTGSICCGRNAAGDFVRCGGWGHLLDDGGSAYALGREALRAALFAEDGRAPESALHRAVMDGCKFRSPLDLLNFVYYSTAGKAEIAALAPLVIQCAADGDQTSLDILEAQTDELVHLAASTVRQLQLEHPPIALMGGLLEHDSLYRQMLTKKIASFAAPVSPAHDALWGAAQMAYECLKQESSEQITTAIS